MSAQMDGWMGRQIRGGDGPRTRPCGAGRLGRDQLPHARAPTAALLYPSGVELGDRRTPLADDGASPPVPLSVPFHFYRRTYHTLYVSPRCLCPWGRAVAEGHLGACISPGDAVGPGSPGTWLLWEEHEGCTGSLDA